ncbi:MAG: hypothetical protein A2W31_15000 [Planctomycetes bacterium RBG_16_64_10]|nr:MAG: hypothetical protein A2W31_15000 [Planctomycetes bacterium RBG_16_64_10]
MNLAWPLVTMLAGVGLFGGSDSLDGAAEARPPAGAIAPWSPDTIRARLAHLPEQTATLKGLVEQARARQLDPACPLATVTVLDNDENEVFSFGSLAFGQVAASGQEAMDARLATWKSEIEKKEQAIEKRFVTPPTGKFYEAIVPDTLDLADRAALAINCLTGALDPDYGYELYFVARFNADPPYMHHEASGLPTNNPKFAESLPMMRLMSGSTQNLDIERRMMVRTLALIADDGLYYAPLAGRPWHHTWHRADDDFANVYGNGRLLLALMAWFQYDGNPLWQEYGQGIVHGLRRVAQFQGDRAYFPDPHIGESFSYPRSGYPANLPEPTDGGFGIPMYFAGVIRALAKWADMTGDQDALDFARRLANYVRQPRVWTPGAELAGVTGAERGHFSGHFHAHVAALRGLLEYAMVADDAELKAFVRSGYEYARNFGLSRIGWFPENTATGQYCEACCTADMVALAIKLGDAGVGDYWEDVDGYVRNQLVEQQLIRTDLLEKLAASSPPHRATPPRETDDRVIERNLGGFAGHGDIATLPNTWIMHCCTGNGSQALYYAWDGVVRENGQGSAQIHLLLNRASPWLDLDSYLPYEGKVVIKNRAAKRISVRIPAWVARREVRSRIGSRLVPADWIGNYLVYDNLKSGDTIEIKFPMVETTTKATLEGKTHTLRFRGNTLVGFSSQPAERGVGIRDGKLVLPGSGRAVAEGVTVTDAQVTVDAKGNAEAGIMLRWQDSRNFLLAIYANGGVYFHEIADGNPGAFLDFVPAPGVGENIHLVVQVDGSEAVLTVTDGTKTATTKHTITGINKAGGVGLFHNKEPAQMFDNFRVADLQGNTIFEDQFNESDDARSRWKFVDDRGSGPNDYPIYQRDHLRSNKAPMVNKSRYVLDRPIERPSRKKDER